MTIKIEKQVPLATKTTLGVGGNASHYVVVRTISELAEAYEYAKTCSQRVCVLGGGSNVLISDEGVDALVLHPEFKECTIKEDGDLAYVTAGAGMVLDRLIEEMIERDLWGLENLSGIPGSVGAVPIQNVGAYGVEAKDVIHEVTVFDPRDNSLRTLSARECMFGYRDSLFKHAEGKHYVVVYVTFRLSRVAQPKIGYKDLALHFASVALPSLLDIRTAVISIRNTKFPDWHTIGTAGSFFKNPIVPEPLFTQLSNRYPGIPGFPHEGKVKVPLGWILDKVLNVRGYRDGAIGLYEKQALVLVNYGGATSADIVEFSDRIIQKIFEATGIRVEREVVLFA